MGVFHVFWQRFLQLDAWNEFPETVHWCANWHHKYCFHFCQMKLSKCPSLLWKVFLVLISLTYIDYSNLRSTTYVSLFFVRTCKRRDGKTLFSDVFYTMSIFSVISLLRASQDCHNNQISKLTNLNQLYLPFCLVKYHNCLKFL